MIPGWRVAAASVIGTSHQNSGAPCQDSHDCRILRARADGDVFVGIAADGAGSVERSDAGSRICCQVISSAIEQYLSAGNVLADLTQNHVLRWLENARLALQATAEEECRPVRDFACTLLAAVVGSVHAVFFQLGDGAIIVSPPGEPGEWCWVFWPQNGEFANTTNFVTDADALMNLQFASRPDAIGEISIFTDGIENLVLRRKERTVHAPFFNAMFPPVRKLTRPGCDSILSGKLAAYLDSAAITNSTDDDKTLLIAVNHAGG